MFCKILNLIHGYERVISSANELALAAMVVKLELRVKISIVAGILGVYRGMRFSRSSD